MKDELQELKDKLFQVHLKRIQYSTKTKGGIDPELEKERSQIAKEIKAKLMEEKIGGKKK